MKTPWFVCMFFFTSSQHFFVLPQVKANKNCASILFLYNIYVLLKMHEHIHAPFFCYLKSAGEKRERRGCMWSEQISHCKFRLYFSHFNRDFYGILTPCLLSCSSFLLSFMPLYNCKHIPKMSSQKCAIKFHVFAGMRLLSLQHHHHHFSILRRKL